MKEPDFKELYFHIMHETERSINILVSAQQYCEAQYLEQTENSERDMTEINTAT